MSALCSSRKLHCLLDQRCCFLHQRGDATYNVINDVSCVYTHDNVFCAHTYDTVFCVLHNNICAHFSAVLCQLLEEELTAFRTSAVASSTRATMQRQHAAATYQLARPTISVDEVCV